MNRTANPSVGSDRSDLSDSSTGSTPARLARASSTLSTPPIVLRSLTKRFKIRAERKGMSFLGGIGDALRGKRHFLALDGVDLEVPRGEMLGVIGMNGAGKSTLLKIIGGISTSTSGEVRVSGRIGSLIEVGAGFHPDLTGYQNVYLNGSIIGLSRAEIDALLPRIVEFAELEGFMDMPVKHYSSGMFVRLGFAVASQLRPDVLLLDETMSVGDIGFQARAVRAIQSFRETGVTVLMVSHDIYTVREYCDRVLWLHEGRTRMIGNPYDVVEAYRDFIGERSGRKTQSLLAMHGDELFSEPCAADSPIAITRLEVRDDAERPIESVRRPTTATVEIGYRCARAVPRIRARVAIICRDSKSVAVERDSERDGTSIGPLQSEGTIRFTFSCEHFNTDVFECIAALYDPDAPDRLLARATATFSLDGCSQPLTEHLRYLASPCDTIEHLPAAGN
jgi:ABC-type polysaccharide/polyol phosphate transport system ATPase subunit